MGKKKNPPSEEHVILVAFTVGNLGDVWTFKQAQKWLMKNALSPLLRSTDKDVTWWIAEDERYDGSDCGSAIFVPNGMTQKQAGKLLYKEGK